MTMILPPLDWSGPLGNEALGLDRHGRPRHDHAGQRPYAIEHTNTRFRTPISKLPMEPAHAGKLIPFSYVHPDRVSVRDSNVVMDHVERLALELGVPKVFVTWFGPTPPGSPVREIDFYHRAPFDDFILGGLASQLWDATLVGDHPPGLDREIAEAASEGLGWIRILHGFRGPALLDVLAHEMRHLWQFAQSTPKPERETDAERFAAEYLQRAA